jgi:hypothetical protein
MQHGGCTIGAVRVSLSFQWIFMILRWRLQTLHFNRSTPPSPHSAIRLFIVYKRVCIYGNNSWGVYYVHILYRLSFRYKYIIYIYNKYKERDSLPELSGRIHNNTRLRLCVTYTIRRCSNYYYCGRYTLPRCLRLYAYMLRVYVYTTW